MARSKSERSAPALFYIDETYKLELDSIKEKHKEDPDHIINRLEAKNIAMLAIAIALKQKLKPKKSKKKAWLIRTEYLKDEDMSILKSLIFDSVNKIEILLPDNYDKFYEAAEELANAGMPKVIDLLNDPKEVEKTILLGKSKIKRE